MAIFQLILCSCFIAASYARTEAEVKEFFLQQAIECNKEFSLTPEEMAMLHQHKVPDSKNAKCLLACVYKKTSWMDDKGMFLTENAYKLAEEKHPDDAEKLKNSEKLFDLCKKVNEQTYSDGDSGCERAAELSNCLTENAVKFGFELE